MKRKQNNTLRVLADVQIDDFLNVDVELSDILPQISNEDLIKELSNRKGISLSEAAEVLGFSSLGNGLSPSLYDLSKLEILLDAYKKYNLEQLQEKLK